MFINNEEPNGNSLDNGENTSMAFQRLLWQPLLSKTGSLEGKMVSVLSPISYYSMQPWDMIPCIPDTLAPAMVERAQGTAQGIAFESSSPKPW